MNNLELLALMHVRGLRRRWYEPTPGDWADVLATFPLFTGVSKRRLRKLAHSATVAEFAPGDPIAFSGDPADSIYIILAGHARTTSRRDRRVLRVGEYFGEATPIDDRPHSETVAAISDVHLMKLPSRSVLKLADKHPAMTLTMLKELTTRLRRLEANAARAT